MIRSITGLGLKQAKDLVEAAPSIIKQGISKQESDDSSNQLQQAGAIVSTACAGGTGGSLLTPPPLANNCTVTLESFGSNKIAVLKSVRSITGLGLKQAKELIEAAPSIIKQGISKQESDDNQSSLQEVGAIVSTTCVGGTP